MDAWIAKNGDNIEMVICNNDGMALGAISSLEKAGYLDGTPESSFQYMVLMLFLKL